MLEVERTEAETQEQQVFHDDISETIIFRCKNHEMPQQHTRKRRHLVRPPKTLAGNMFFFFFLCRHAVTIWI